MITCSIERLVTTDGRSGGRCGRALRCVRRSSLAVLACAAASVLGCSVEQKYDPPVHEEGVGITAADLGVPPEALVGFGRKILENEPSSGRFPAGVAVIRVTAMKEEDGNRRYLRVAPMTTEDAIYWMHLWDDLPRIREVTRLRTLGLDPRGVNYDDILRESLNIRCDLCIIYACVSESEADAEFVGVLWDALHHRALATFRESAILTEEMREKTAKSKNHDRWSGEAEYRAMADLRQSVRNVMWDIAAKDQTPATTQPNPWTKYDYLEVYPREYDRWERVKARERTKKASDDPSPKSE